MTYQELYKMVKEASMQKEALLGKVKGINLLAKLIRNPKFNFRALKDGLTFRTYPESIFVFGDTFTTPEFKVGDRIRKLIQSTKNPHLEQIKYVFNNLRQGGLLSRTVTKAGDIPNALSRLERAPIIRRLKNFYSGYGFPVQRNSRFYNTPADYTLWDLLNRRKAASEVRKELAQLNGPTVLQLPKL